MNNDIIEKYKSELLSLHKKSRPAVAAVADNNQTTNPTVNPPQNQTPVPNVQTPIPQPVNPPTAEPQNQTGSIIAEVVTVRSLYPVEGAMVYIFEGPVENMKIIGQSMTDQSGKTTPFILSTPAKSLSLDSGNTILPYAQYNMLVTADGYLDNIHLNIPVFSGVISLQRSNMMLEETAGVNKGAQIFDESSKYLSDL